MKNQPLSPTDGTPIPDSAYDPMNNDNDGTRTAVTGQDSIAKNLPTTPEKKPIFEPTAKQEEVANAFNETLGMDQEQTKGKVPEEVAKDGRETTDHVLENEGVVSGEKEVTDTVSHKASGEGPKQSERYIKSHVDPDPQHQGTKHVEKHTEKPHVKGHAPKEKDIKKSKK